MMPSPVIDDNGGAGLYMWQNALLETLGKPAAVIGWPVMCMPIMPSKLMATSTWYTLSRAERL